MAASCPSETRPMPASRNARSRRPVSWAAGERSNRAVSGTDGSGFGRLHVAVMMLIDRTSGWIAGTNWIALVLLPSTTRAGCAGSLSWRHCAMSRERRPGSSPSGGDSRGASTVRMRRPALHGPPSALEPPRGVRAPRPPPEVTSEFETDTIGNMPRPLSSRRARRNAESRAEWRSAGPSAGCV